MNGRPEPSARRREQQRKTEDLAKSGFGVIAVAQFLLTQFTTEEHTLDIPEHWPSFTFDTMSRVTLSSL